MANFTKDDLAYSGYKHTARPGDDPRITGKPDSTTLNRGESYEMVYFINRYMKEKGWGQKTTFQKIERFLQESNEKNKSHAFWRNKLKEQFRLN